MEQITYYARFSEGYSRNNPAGIVRRRFVDSNEYDEAFTRNLRWEPAEYLRLYDLGHNEDDHGEITEAEAETFITKVTQKITEEIGINTLTHESFPVMDQDVA